MPSAHEPNIDDFVSLINRKVEELIRKQSYQFLQGTWQGAEAEDANLSSIDIEGITVRWARKLEHVTGLAVGDQVICIKGPGVPVTIVGVIIGDITKAEV